MALKKKNDRQKYTKHIEKSRLSNTNPSKTWGNLWCSGIVSRSCTICDTRCRARQTINPLKSIVRLVTFGKKGIIPLMNNNYSLSQKPLLSNITRFALTNHEEKVKSYHKKETKSQTKGPTDKTTTKIKKDKQPSAIQYALGLMQCDYDPK